MTKRRPIKQARGSNPGTPTSDSDEENQGVSANVMYTVNDSMHVRMSMLNEK